MDEKIEGELVISGNCDGENVTIKTKISSILQQGKLLQSLAAHSLITEMEKVVTNKDKIIEISKKFRVLSKYTSFIVINKANTEPIEETMKMWKNTEFLDISRGTIGGPRKRGRAKKQATKAKKSRSRSPGDDDDDLESMELENGVMENLKKRKSLFEEKMKINEKSEISDKFQEFLTLQNANGSWKVEGILKYLNIDQDTLSKGMKELYDNKNYFVFSNDKTRKLDINIWASVVALAVLLRDFLAIKRNWNLMYDKTLNWLKKNNQKIDVIQNSANDFVKNLLVK